MTIFLHNQLPTATLFSFGPFSIYWYGLCLVSGIISAILITFYLAKSYQVSREDLFDLSFWLIVAGLTGARLYDVLLELPYYIDRPFRVFAVWQGGLAIHGAIIAGLLTVWIFSQRRQIYFFKLSSLLVPGLALGQAVGRWGNYFNQELFGLPTSLPWGIPINVWNRPIAYVSSDFFHPTFLYESLGCLIIFALLILRNYLAFKNGRPASRFYVWSVGLYMILYSILRFLLEFIKIDTTPIWFGLRWPQLMSLTIIAATIFAVSYSSYARRQQKEKSQ